MSDVLKYLDEVRERVSVFHNPDLLPLEIVEIDEGENKTKLCLRHINIPISIAHVHGPDQNDRKYFKIFVTAKEDLDRLERMLRVAVEALEFYRNGAHWTTHDEGPMLFNNVTDQDWQKNESGYFVGGKISRDAHDELNKIASEGTNE